MAVLPWHTTIFQQLLMQRQHLPHAWLLYGQANIGKLSFAEHLAKSLLCQTPLEDGSACNTCQSCHWQQQAQHPDFRRICPPSLMPLVEMQAEDLPSSTESPDNPKDSKKASQEISVTQIRGLADFVNLSAHQGGLRIILVYPVMRLNLNAANALLKTLEEPSAKTLFILISEHLDILPTILSRCQPVLLPSPNTQQALDWLLSQNIMCTAGDLAIWGGAPCALATQHNADWLQGWLNALQHPKQHTPFQIAEKFSQAPLPELLSVMQRWISHLAQSQQGIKQQFAQINADEVSRLLNNIPLSNIVNTWQRILNYVQHANHPLNAKLNLETLWLDYVQLWQKKV